MKKLIMFVLICTVGFTTVASQELKSKQNYYGFKNPYRGNLSESEMIEAVTVLMQQTDTVRIKYYWNITPNFGISEMKNAYIIHAQNVFGKIFQEKDMIALAKKSELTVPPQNFKDEIEISRFDNEGGVDWSMRRNRRPGELLFSYDGKPWSSNACLNMLRNAPQEDIYGYVEPKPEKKVVYVPQPQQPEQKVVYVPQPQQPEQKVVKIIYVCGNCNQQDCRGGCTQQRVVQNQNYQTPCNGCSTQSSGHYTYENGYTYSAAPQQTYQTCGQSCGHNHNTVQVEKKNNNTVGYIATGLLSFGAGYLIGRNNPVVNTFSPIATPFSGFGINRF